MERAAGSAHDARLQPSDTTEPGELGGMQGGSVVPFGAGQFVRVYGMVSKRVTAETPNFWAGLRQTCLKAWNAVELLHAKLHCVYGTNM